MKISKKQWYVIAGLVAVILLAVAFYIYRASQTALTENSSSNDTANTNTEESIDTADSQNDQQTDSSTGASLEISSPSRGATLSDGDKIVVKTANTSDKVIVIVSSDKWGEVYQNNSNTQGTVEFVYSPNQTVPAGSSGSINARLVKDGNTLVEKSTWVNF